MIDLVAHAWWLVSALGLGCLVLLAVRVHRLRWRVGLRSRQHGRRVSARSTFAPDRNPVTPAPAPKRHCRRRIPPYD